MQLVKLLLKLELYFDRVYHIVFHITRKTEYLNKPYEMKMALFWIFYETFTL
jgi:hypothetical protein